MRVPRLELEAEPFLWCLRLRDRALQALAGRLRVCARPGRGRGRCGRRDGGRGCRRCRDGGRRTRDEKLDVAETGDEGALGLLCWEGMRGGPPESAGTPLPIPVSLLRSPDPTAHTGLGSLRAQRPSFRSMRTVASCPCRAIPDLAHKTDYTCHHRRPTSSRSSFMYNSPDESPQGRNARCIPRKPRWRKICCMMVDVIDLPLRAVHANLAWPPPGPPPVQCFSAFPTEFSP